MISSSTWKTMISSSNSEEDTIFDVPPPRSLFHPDNGCQVPQMVKKVSVNIRQLFFIKVEDRDLPRSKDEEYRNEMNRTGFFKLETLHYQ
ncbi:hypothetical protein B9Z55_022136 [Caenorhabditis nigoni]|nr:hypothetical protein B9Z55_022136 [Caenorhabditis nigoni]